MCNHTQDFSFEVVSGVENETGSQDRSFRSNLRPGAVPLGMKYAFLNSRRQRLFWGTRSVYRTCGCLDGEGSGSPHVCQLIVVDLDSVPSDVVG